jgi:NAD(P)-dependent dehydrogenase (short-subunit alcohol dehydrogenase family)
MPKIFLVTGATAGFGAAIVRRVVSEGHRCVAVGRRFERLEQLKEELDCASLHIAKLDVTSRSACESFLSSLPEEMREIDVLVNNAGLALGLEPAHAASLDDWETMVDTNIKGLMFMTRALLPGMVQRKRGHVINIASTVSLSCGLSSTWQFSRLPAVASHASSVSRAGCPLSIPRSECIRRKQSLCCPIFPQPARRPQRHVRARHGRGAGHELGHGIQQRALQGRRR